MAPPAGDVRRPLLADLRALLAPAPGRGELAFRLALICALTTLVVETYQTPSQALSAYVVFFLNKPDRTSSILTDIMLALLITIVVAMVLLLAIAVIDQPGWRVAAMTFFSFGMLFLASASKLRPIGGIMALIVAYALDLLGNVPGGELATRGLLYAWLFVAIPAGMSLAVNLMIAPSPRRLAEKALGRQLAAAAAMLRSPGVAERQTFARCLAGGSAELLGRLRLAGLERTSPKQDMAALVQATHSTTELLFLVDAIVMDGSAPAAWRETAAATLDEMAAVFREGGYPVNIAAPFAAEPDPLRNDFERVLARFADPVPAPPPSHGEKAGFFLPDAFSNSDHVHYALKTTGAAMACYILYQLLDWPGIHTCLITCYIVSLGTTGETVEKLSLRIVGCLIGAAAGLAAIIWVVPALDSIGGLLAIVFLGALASGWVAAGSPRISYAGFQIAFAFFLCVIQGSSPAFDLAVARDRVIGILLGNLVVYLVFTRLWPVSVSQRLDPAIAALLRQLGGMARAGATARPALLPAIQSAAAAVEGDLAVARYEPRAIRPSSNWLDRRRQAALAVAGLEGPLLLSGGDPSFLRSAAERLDRVADRLDPNGMAPSAPAEAGGPAEPSGHPLGEFVERRLGQLETALA